MLLISLGLLPDATAAELVQLRAPEAVASSFLKSNWNKYTENYHPSYLLDGDPKTAWVEGASGAGAGEWVSWAVSPLAKVDVLELKIRNGYQKSESLLTANAAPKVLVVKWMANGRIQHETDWAVGREMGWQTLTLDPPRMLPLDEIRLEVREVVEGRTYADLCISDVEVRVAADAPYSAPVEKAKHQALLDWIGDRQATAKYFASKPKTYPFASTSFTVRESEVPKSEHGEAFAAMESLLAARTALLAHAPTPQRFDTKDPVVKPDGLEMPDALARWFSPDRTFFEAKSEWRTTEKALSDWHMEHREANAHISRRPDGTLAAATYGEYDKYEERGVYTYDRQYYLELDRDERISRILTHWQGEEEGCSMVRSTALWTVTRDSAGRASELTRLERVICEQDWDSGETHVNVRRAVFSPVES